MSLSVKNVHFEKVVEHDTYWDGQMKYYIWMETHNEDCDSKFTSLDMEPHD